MSTRNELNDQFLLQNFTGSDGIAGNLDRYKMIAAGYAQTENVITVLSDLKERVWHPAGLHPVSGYKVLGYFVSDTPLFELE